MGLRENKGKLILIKKQVLYAPCCPSSISLPHLIPMVAMLKRLGASDLQYNAVHDFGLMKGAQENSASAHLTLYSASMESTIGMCRHSIKISFTIGTGRALV
jgi:hypothetical protein